MKYSQIIEVNQLLETEEVIQQYKRPQTYEQAKQRALSLAIERWKVIPKALHQEDGWQHTEIYHLKMLIR